MRMFGKGRPIAVRIRVEEHRRHSSSCQQQRIRHRNSMKFLAPTDVLMVFLQEDETIVMSQRSNLDLDLYLPFKGVDIPMKAHDFQTWVQHVPPIFIYYLVMTNSLPWKIWKIPTINGGL